MAASESYFARPNYAFFSGERNSSIGSDSMFELDESDIWSVSVSPELRKTVPSSRISKSKRLSAAAAAKRGGEVVGGMASSLPVNVPDWSKILKENYTENRRRESDEDYGFDDDDYNNCGGGGFGSGDRIPPHEFLARTRMASFSVHEGIGRTLKGRDLSRVRNAIWEKTGFED